MAEAALSVIRVGESVWATWEPEDGSFDLEWVSDILDGAHDRGIGVILGTPTYAIPTWLARKYPEIMAERRTGEPIPYGHRQNVDYSHAAFRWHAERIVRRIVERHAGHPAVIGYQVDNEPGAELFHNTGAFQGFLGYLKKTYGTVEELNRRWGLTYWSHRLGDWADLWRPDGNTTQGYDLAWRRYQAGLTTDFIRSQVALVRELARDDQFITTCLAYGRPGMDDVALARTLDIVSVNPYYAMQDAFTRPRVTGPSQGQKPAWSWGSGTWWLALESDVARGNTGMPFLVTETDAGSIGDMWSNYPAYDGQWRQAVWTFVARGAQLVEYWHWHTLHYGIETYWGGVLGHSLEPGRTYAEVATIGRELAAAGAAVVGLRPDVDVAFVRSNDSRWAFQFQPPIPRPGSDQPDTDAYDTIFSAFYRGFNDAGVQAAVISPDDVVVDPATLVATYPVLVVPALYVATDEVLEALRAFAFAGGHLVSTFRTGYADADATARHEVMPGVLRAAVGASYLEFSNLSRELPLVAGPGSTLNLAAGASATAWSDGLVVEGATVLAAYEHPHFGRWPAIISHAHGAGRVTYVGTLPDDGTIAALARWVVPEPANRDWGGLPAPVTVTGATAADGGRVHFVHNWSWVDGRVAAPTRLTDLDGRVTLAGGWLELGPWDVRVLFEDAS